MHFGIIVFISQRYLIRETFDGHNTKKASLNTSTLFAFEKKITAMFGGKPKTGLCRLLFSLVLDKHRVRLTYFTLTTLFCYHCPPCPHPLCHELTISLIISQRETDRQTDSSITFICLTHLTHHLSLYKLLLSNYQAHISATSVLYRLGKEHCVTALMLFFVGDQLTSAYRPYPLTLPPTPTFIYVTQLTHHLSFYKLLH